MKIRFVIHLLLLMAVAVTVDPPVGSRVVVSDDSGAAWSQTGENGCSVALARAKWYGTLTRQRWTLKDEFHPAGAPDQFFSVWTKQDSEIILMLWRIDSGNSGFSWGDSSAGGECKK